MRRKDRTIESKILSKEYNQNNIYDIPVSFLVRFVLIEKMIKKEV